MTLLSIHIPLFPFCVFLFDTNLFKFSVITLVSFSLVFSRIFIYFPSFQFSSVLHLLFHFQGFFSVLHLFFIVRFLFVSLYFLMKILFYIIFSSLRVIFFDFRLKSFDFLFLRKRWFCDFRCLVFPVGAICDYMSFVVFVGQKVIKPG